MFEDLGFRADASIKIAYSGGLDSHCLLHALAKLRDSVPLRIEAVHVDHGLQAASREWSRHCQQICAALAVPCQVERLEGLCTRKGGLEAVARQARYAAIERHMRRDDILVTAHQEDDQAETVLLHLLRGTGVRGLAGMPAITAFGSGLLARPLLEFSRALLQAYALAQDLTWVEDSSNQDPRYRRNRLRREVLPMLETHWPKARELLARNAAHAAETSEILDDMARQDLAQCVLQGRIHSNGARAWRFHEPPLSITALRVLSRPRRRNLLRFWIRLRGFYAPSVRHLDEIETQIICLPKTQHARIAWPQAEARRYRDELYVMAPLAQIASDLSLPWDMSMPLTIPGTGCCLRPVSATGSGIALERVQHQPVQVCLRRGGEICRPRGQSHRQKLKKLLQASGLEPWLRERAPLVYVGDELAAVADLWVCEPFAARTDEPGIVPLWETI